MSELCLEEAEILAQHHPAAFAFRALHFRGCAKCRNRVAPIPSPPADTPEALKLMEEGWWLEIVGHGSSYLRIHNGKHELLAGDQWVDISHHSRWVYGCANPDRPATGEIIVVRPEAPQ